MGGTPEIRLGPFELAEPIGRGGMGEVWRGRHGASDTPVAVKVVTAERAKRRRLSDALKSEVRAVARLHHRHIIMVFDHGTVSADAARASGDRLRAGSPYLAMELVTGGTLDTDRDAPSWGRAKNLLLDILDALAHAHARGVIHRDLKPGNVLLPGPGDVRRGLKLTDFGIARALDDPDRENQAARISGTLRYMAPEQIAGHWRDEGPWTDLYALGMIAYRLTTGRLPFGDASGDQLVHCHFHVPVPRLDVHLGDDTPRGFDEWLYRMVAKKVVNRFERAADAAHALRQLAGARPAHVGEAAEPDVDTDVDGVVTTGDSGADAPLTRAVAWYDVDTAEAISPEAETAAPTTSQTPAPAPGADVIGWEEAERFTTPVAIPPQPRSWRRPATPPLQLLGAGLGLYGLRPVPMIARERERDILWTALRAVADHDTARLVLLSGAAGCGKSRVVEWIAERAHEVGAATVLRATHSPIAGPSDGLEPMLARHLDVAGLDRGAIVARCRRFVDAHPLPDGRAGEGDRAHDALALAELVAPTRDGDAAGDPRVRFSTPADRYRAARRALERVSARRPVIVWIDDVQWGADALAFVDFLIAGEHTAPLRALVLATARNDALVDRAVERGLTEELLSRANAGRLEIAALTEDEQRELVERMLGLSGELAARVVARTSGNPLFAVQLVGDWIERGLLRAQPSGFALVPGAEAELPDSLHQVWSERTRTVTRDLRGDPIAALQLAAALGQDVDGGEWRAACALAAIDIDDELLGRLFASRLAVDSADGWAFAHGMLRESLERGARESDRLAAHHAACADMLAARYPADDAAAAARRGRHLVLAGRLAEALAPLHLAAEQRRLEGDFPRAHALYAERLATMRQLALDPSDPRWGESWVGRARAFCAEGRVDEAASLAGRALSASTEHRWDGVRARVDACLGHIALAQGDPARGRDAFARAITRLRAIGDRAGLADALGGFGRVCMWLRELDDATAAYEEAHALFADSGDAYELGHVLRGLSGVTHCAGDLERAADLLERARACFERTGSRLEVASSTNDLGEIARARGDLGAAEALYREAGDGFDALGCADASTPRFNLGLVQLERGDYDGARATFESELAAMEDVGRTIDRLWLCAGLLPCAAAAGRWRAMNELLDRVDALLKGFVDEDIAWCAHEAGKLASRAGRGDAARRAYELARDQWREMENTGKLAEVEAALANSPSPPRGEEGRGGGT